jgi:hypothetical protein
MERRDGRTVSASARTGASGPRPMDVHVCIFNRDANPNLDLCDKAETPLFNLTYQKPRNPRDPNSKATIGLRQLVLPPPGVQHQPNYCLLKLGQGSFGQVFKGRLGTQKVAIKIFNSKTQMDIEYKFVSAMNSKSRQTPHQDRFQRWQLGTTEKMVFPRVLLRAEKFNNNINCLVFELVEGCHLKKFLMADGYKDNVLVFLNVFIEFAISLKHLQEKCKIRHRDIKGDNVMVRIMKGNGIPEYEVFFKYIYSEHSLN